MSIDTSNNIGNGALLTSGAGGIVTAINEYSIIIGLSLTLVSIIIGLIFHIRADRWRKQESARNRAELTREIMKELEKEKSNKSD